MNDVGWHSTELFATDINVVESGTAVFPGPKDWLIRAEQTQMQMQ